MEAKPFI